MNLLLRAPLLVSSVLAMVGTTLSTEAVSAASQPQASCSTVRLTPYDGSRFAFTNTQIRYSYTSPQAGVCGNIELVDGAGKPIATKQIYRSEWTNPQGGVAGAVTLEPIDSLPAASTYRVMRVGAQLSIFGTSGRVPRGTFTKVVDQNVTFGDLPKSPLIPVAIINNLLREYLTSTIHDPALVKTAYDVVSKVVPNLAHPQARYNARVKKISYVSDLPYGMPVRLSGLLIYPENPDGTPFDFSSAGMVLGEPTPESNKPAVSSASTADVIVGLLAAGKGQVFLPPI